ncbi:MAG: hypothetical protein AB8H79_24135 [Myxococcota bacterium]
MSPSDPYRTPLAWTPKTAFVLLAVAGLFGSAPALADKVRDFTDAADVSKGCDLIPYSYERGQCKKHKSYVDKYCKNKPVSCSNINLKDTRAEKMVEERLENHRQCLSHREQVQETFSDALNKVKRETRNRDAKIAAAAEQIVENIQKGARDHEKATRDAKEGVKACEDMKESLPEMTGR